MKKKILLIFLFITIFVLSLISIIIFTDWGNKTIHKIYVKLFMTKEVIMVDGQNTIKVTYTYGNMYGKQDEVLDVPIADGKLIKNIEKEVLNKKLVDYTSEIALLIHGDYTVDLGNGVKFKFDQYQNDGYVRMYNKDKNFLTKINPEILKSVKKVVYVKLTEKSKMFQTDNITISNVEGIINVERKTMVEFILEQCKYIYTKELDYTPKSNEPEYTLNFNNGIKIFKYEHKDKGYLSKDNVMYEVYCLNVFDVFLQNLYNKTEEKQKWFTADKVTLSTPYKTLEIIDKEAVEKITSILMYSDIMETDWLKNYNLKSDVDIRFSIKINDVEFLIPADKIDGNRYLILPNGDTLLCFPFSSLEKYLEEYM